MYIKALLLLILLAIPACSQVLPRKTYLIPEGTRGYVYILKDVGDGEKIETKLGETVFVIPESRILAIQSIEEPSVFVDNYYYIAKDGNRIPLDEEPSSVHNTPENLADNRPFVFGRAAGIHNWSDIPCEVKYDTFYVGTRALLLSRTQQDRDKEYEDFKAFVTANAGRICSGKPPSKAGVIRLFQRRISYRRPRGHA